MADVEGNRYWDIIGRGRPLSVRHPRMPQGNRAAQFAAYAALSGYGEAIDEAGKMTVQGIGKLDSRERRGANRQEKARPFLP